MKKDREDKSYRLHQEIRHESIENTMRESRNAFRVGEVERHLVKVYDKLETS